MANKAEQEEEFTEEDFAAAQAVEDEEEISEEELFAAAEAAPQQPVQENLKPSRWGNVVDAAGAIGIPLPEEGSLRGAAANLLGGATRNWADELAGLRARTRDFADAIRKGPGPIQMGGYETARDDFRQREGAFRQENPGTALALGVAGGMLSGGPVQTGSTGLAKYLPAAVEGAVSGAGSAEDIRDVPAMSVGGAVLGPLVQRTAEGAGKLGGNLLRGVVQRSKAAKKLQEMGVEGLTTGQLAPDSALGQLEEASTSVGGVGPAIQAQRQAAKESWQDAVLRRGLAPGAELPPATLDLPERLDQLAQGFTDAYRPARGVPMVPVTSEGLPLRATPDSPSVFDAVVEAPSVLATKEQRKVVKKFLNDQLSLLPKAVGEVPSDTLLKIRANIREKAREYAKREAGKEIGELLEGAEDAVTDVLEHQLPADAVKALRGADRAYAQFKVVEAAVRGAKDNPQGFSPYNLTSAISSQRSGESFARGGGGALRQLARQGRAVFDSRSPTTGARLLTTGPFGWAVAPLAYMANRPAAQRVLLGDTPTQKAIAEYVERNAAPLSSSLVRFAFDESISEEDERQRALIEALRRRPGQ
jgi:hypothetical protein